MRNEEYLHLFGNINYYSSGTSVVMADRQIKRALQNHTVALEEIGNQKAIITDLQTGKWFLLCGGWDNNNVSTAMLGAACGDIAGSIYEHHNIKYKPNTETLIRNVCRFTDDTVMTCAVAEGLRRGLEQLPLNWLEVANAEEILYAEVQKSLQRFGRRYPYAGYGGSFYRWIMKENPAPYNSWGNGSAMRASYAGWVANSLEEAEKLAEISAKVTHNHPEGIKGAQVVAGSIFLLRDGKSKLDVADYVSTYYDMNFTLDGIRDRYYFDVSCQGSVPYALKAFLEEESFVDVIAAAISIGGDSDTIAAVAGSVAEVIYPIPQEMRAEVIDKLDATLKKTIVEAVDFFVKRLK